MRLKSVYYILVDSDFAYHKVSVVFWQSDERNQLASITEPYEKIFTAANLKKELEFYDSELTFNIRQVSGGKESNVMLILNPGDDVGKKFKTLMSSIDDVISIEWKHRHYVRDDEYIPYEVSRPAREYIPEFLEREIARPIIRWESNEQLGYEILPNRYFYIYQPPKPAKELLADFWALEKEAEKILGRLPS